MDIEKCNCFWRNYIIELGKVWIKKKKKELFIRGIRIMVRDWFF